MVMNVSGPPWVVDIPSPASGVVNFGLVDEVVLGDSYEARGNANTIVTAASRVGGVATYTCAGHGMATGQIGTFCNMQDSSFNLANVRVTRIDANTLSAVSLGPDAATTNLDGLSNGTTKKPMTLINRASRTDNGWFQRYAHESGGSTRIVHNGGAPGQTAADMLERFDREFTQFRGASRLKLHTGYNDFVNAGRSAEAVYADISLIAIKARALGMLVDIANCGPWVTGGTATSRAEAARYNRILRNLEATIPGVRVIDVCSALIDPSNATGMYPLANMIGGDGVHLTAKGIRFWARAMWVRLSPGWAATAPLVSSNVDNYGATLAASSPVMSRNILDFGPWSATGGRVNAPVTGTAPDGYDVYANNPSAAGTFACTAVARADGIGFDLVATVTSGGPNDQFIVNFRNNIPSSRFAAGDKIRVMFELALSGTSGANLKGLLCGIYFVGGTANPTDYITTVTATSAAEYGATDETIRMVSEDIVVPADGVTGYGFQLYTIFASSGGPLTLKYGRASHDKVS